MRLDITDNVLCPDCKSSFSSSLSRSCASCSRILSRCICSHEYLEEHRVSRVYKAFRYLNNDQNAAASRLVFSLKNDNRRDVLAFCRDILVDTLCDSGINPSECVFVSVPRRRSAIIKFGFDHAKMLSRSVASKLGCEYLPIFGTKAKIAQKSLDFDQRRKNATFYIKKKTNLKYIQKN